MEYFLGLHFLLTDVVTSESIFPSLLFKSRWHW